MQTASQHTEFLTETSVFLKLIQNKAYLISFYCFIKLVERISNTMNFGSCDGVETSVVSSPHKLSTMDLVEEYQKLSISYNNQKELIDQCRQQIYKLTQEKTLADNIMKDELQSVTESCDRELENVRRRCMADNKDLQNRLSEMNVTNEKLECENERLKKELNAANNPLKCAVAAESKVCDKDETIVSNKRIEYLEKIETEYLTLIDEISKLNSAKSELASQLIQVEVISLYL